MTERIDSTFGLDDMDIVQTYETQHSDGGDDFPPESGDGDDGEDRPERLRVTFSGKALQQICEESERLGIERGAFVRKSLMHRYYLCSRKQR